MARVVVGLSGGVDSSVAALLLKEQGHEVIGVFMRNWNDESVTIDGECPWIDDSNDAMLVAEKLDIPFQVIDLSAEYKERIVDYMFAEYEAGRTPNPDVLCNREIKFDTFLKYAVKLGADYVATGHYCRKSSVKSGGKTIYRLLAGRDKNKDQSYFLCQVNQDQLARALFPIGEIEKPEVRRVAAEAGLVTAGKKDSQGLCFVGKVHLPDFLQQKLAPKTGKVIEIPAEIPVLAGENVSGDSLEEKTRPAEFSPGDGRQVGEHNGAHFFTIGQRKGLRIGGMDRPLFVVGTDVKSNTVYVGRGEDHPALYRRGFFVGKDDIHWLRPDLRMQEGEEREYLGRIRYRQALRPVNLFMREKGLYVLFEKPAKAVTPGQFAAFYSGEELVASGIIS